MATLSVFGLYCLVWLSGCSSTDTDDRVAMPHRTRNLIVNTEDPLKRIEGIVKMEIDRIEYEIREGSLCPESLVWFAQRYIEEREIHLNNATLLKQMDRIFVDSSRHIFKPQRGASDVLKRTIETFNLKWKVTTLNVYETARKNIER